MTDAATEKLRLLEMILDAMPVGVTYVDSEGNILYCNRKAVERPSPVPRVVGRNIKDCHKPLSNRNVQRIFNDFKNGRREPHHYISHLTGEKELVTHVPIFEGDDFVGNLGIVHTLEVKGPERTF